MGSLSLLQGIFPTQELNQGLLHCRWILYQLSYQGTNNLVNKYLVNGHLFTLNCIRTYAVWEPDEAILEARKKGVFRYKVWQGDNYAKYMIESLISDSQFFHFSNDTLSFLHNKLMLSWLYDYYTEEEKRIIKGLTKIHKDRIKKQTENHQYIEENIVKDLLVYIEDLFNKEKKHTHGRFDDLSGYSLNQIADSVSYLIYLAYENIKSIPKYGGFVNNTTIESFELRKIILSGCKICQATEWEVMVDFFNYNVFTNDKHSYIIKASNPDFEKSYRLAYIFQETQRFLVEQRIIESGSSKSIKDVCDYYVKNLKYNIVSLKSNYGITRLVINVNPELIRILNSINKRNMYLEELISIKQLSHDYTNNEKELLERNISEHCTLHDVVIFQRLFIFLSYLSNTFIYSQGLRKIIMDSLVPTLKKDKLENLLMIVYQDKNKSSEMIKLFTATHEKKLDLLYTPLIYMDNGYYIPLSLTAKSNLLRNCIASSRALGEQKANQMNEPLVAECEEIFKRCLLNNIVCTNNRIKYNDQQGEIDVFVVTENYIIIVECKCPLFPVNNFEMRGVNDHLQKAIKQLDFWKNAFLDKQFQIIKMKDWGIPYKERQVLTCIVFGNRLFNGLSFNGHPVRFINELNNFLINGSIRTKNKEYHLWSTETLTEKDICDYLSDKSKTTRFRFDAMIESKESIKLKGEKLYLESYAVTQEAMDYQLDSNFVSKEK